MLGFMLGRRFYGALIVNFSIVLSSFTLMPVATAIDGSDAEPPRIESISQTNIGASATGSRILIEVKTSDDKNLVKLNGSVRLQANFPKEFENISPICKYPNELTFGLIPGLGFLENRDQFQNNGRIQQVFYFVTQTPYFRKELPAGCPDFRDSKYFSSQITLNLQDESGRNLFAEKEINLISQPSLILGDQDIEYFCLYNSKFTSQIENSLKQLPNLKVPVKIAGIEGQTEIYWEMINSARLKYETTRATIQQPSLEKIKILPKCNYLESQIMSNASVSIYKEVQLATSREFQKLQQSKTITIVCVKGKLSKKVTGKNPKCPSGYSKKS